MRTIILQSEENSNELFITGDINDIFTNRRAARFLKDTLQYRRIDDAVYFSVGDDLNKTIGRVKKLCDYIAAELRFSSNVSAAIGSYVDEERKFEEFSEKARSIRDNHCNHDDFQSFTDAVARVMSKRSLYQLQLLSAYHLAFSQNACNFSVPGAGKTSVVFGAYAYLSSLPLDNSKHVDCILVISPLSAFGPWELEYEECFGTKPITKRLNAHLSLEEKKQYLYSLRPATITLLSYASVATLKEELKFFLKQHRTMVVLDEAHKIKNTAGGITASGVLEIAADCTARVVLTGTPAPNGYEDLYNLYKFIWPSQRIIPYEVNQLKDMSRTQEDARVPRLISNIKPFFIRVRKSDLGIPLATEHEPMHIVMGEAQRRIYDVIEKKCMKDIINSRRDRDARQELVKARLIRLMQAATNPGLLRHPLRDFTEAGSFDVNTMADDAGFVQDVLQYSSIEVPSKFIAARDLVRNIISNGGKAVIWAIYINNILELSAYLESEGIACKMLYGATPVSSGEEDEDDVETREKIIAEFNRPDSSFRVVIANPFAVAESISLHKACHNAIYLERSFNAAHFIQSKDRIHRYGLPPGTETNYYYILGEDSIDDVIHERLRAKEARLNEIIESSPIPLFDNAALETGDDDMKALITEYVNRTKKV